VLAWIFRRCQDAAEAEETPVGCIPTADGIDLSGLDLSDEAFEAVRTVDLDALRDELPQVREHLEKFGDALPAELWSQFDAHEQRLGATAA
jgi:phosphoenolpyruvate carboxykinase (GTP)